MSGSVLIVGGDVVVEREVISPGAVAIDSGRISAVGTMDSVEPPADATRIDATGLTVAPGLLDIQINGGFGHDFTHEAESIWDVGAKLPQFGVTGFLPTVVTSGAESRRAMLAALAAGPPSGYVGATPMGVHFEGPFISPEASGAHDTSFLRLPSRADADVAGWSAAGGVRLVTLAPELDGALHLIRSLVVRGVVVSLGHTAATFEQANSGFDAGAHYVTHLFNAMTPLGHREPGMVGAALLNGRVTLGLIPDGIHVHPGVMRIVADLARPGRISTVTDATAALGMAPGRYVLGGRNVVLDGTSVRLVDDGRLAGSALTADEALRGFSAATRWLPVDTIASMTSVPARLLGLADRGAIEVGRRADLALFTQDLQVVMTFVGGERWA